MLKLSYLKTKPMNSENVHFRTFQGAIEYFSTTKPESEAFVFASTNGSRETVTWRELCQTSQLVAKSFIKLGIQRQEIVAINARSNPELVFVYFGAMYAGAIPVMVSFTNDTVNCAIALIKKMGKCAMIIVDPGDNDEQWNILSNLLNEYPIGGKVSSSQLPYLRYMLLTNCPRNIENVLTLKHLVSTLDSSDVHLPEIAEDDVAALFPTSGSTGVPKLVTHTYRSFRSALTFDAERQYLDHLHEGVYNDRPFGWMGGFPLNVWFGTTRVAINGNSPPPVDRIGFMIDVIKRERCANVYALSPVIRELAQRKDEFGDEWPVKWIVTGSGPITKSIATSALSISKNIVNEYGSTETIYVSIFCCDDVDDFKDYTTGTMSPDIELKVVDDYGVIVPVLTTGTIHLRSASMFKDYWNDPEKTTAVKAADGWHNTDDIGKLDENGHLYVFKRKSMIVSGGINVAPESIENAIKLCPDVDDVIAIPVPDADMFQAVCACVILKPMNNATEQDIQMFCEDKANHKVGLFPSVLPKYYMILESFPELSSGKYSRSALSAMAIARFKSY